MKKTMRVNASYALAAILSIVLFTALCRFASVAAKSADATDAKQTTGYGTVDWSTADRGFITFTASGQGGVFAIQGPGGKQSIHAADEGETVKVPLEDSSGTFHFAIGSYADDGTDCRVAYKSSFTVA